MSAQEPDIQKRLEANLDEQIAHLEEQRRRIREAEAEAQRREAYLEVIKTAGPVLSLGTALINVINAFGPSAPAQTIRVEVQPATPQIEQQFDTDKLVSSPRGDVGVRPQSTEDTEAP